MSNPASKTQCLEQASMKTLPLLKKAMGYAKGEGNQYECKWTRVKISWEDVISTCMTLPDYAYEKGEKRQRGEPIIDGNMVFRRQRPFPGNRHNWAKADRYRSTSTTQRRYMWATAIF